MSIDEVTTWLAYLALANGEGTKPDWESIAASADALYEANRNGR